MPSSPTCRATPLPAGERRAAIIAAALPLLIEQGGTVTSRQIATAAGVSEGTIFNVFGDKEELLAAALETAIDQAPFENSVSEIDSSQSFGPQLVEATTIIQRRIVEIWRLISQLGRHDHPPEHKPFPDSPALAALFAAHPGRLRIEPDEAGRLLRALTLSLTHPLLTSDPYDPAEIVDMFLHGTEATQ